MIKRVIKLLIAMGFRAIEQTIGFFRKGNEKLGTCVVLMYHDVTAENHIKFIRQMEIVTQLATPIATDLIPNFQRGKHHVAVTFDDGFASTIELVLPVLKNKMIPVTFFIPSAHLGSAPEWFADMARLKRVGAIISAESLRLLGELNGVIIGSHGMCHRPLTEINDYDAFRELTGSKRVLEALTGKAVNMHSFPFGAYEDRHVVMAREAGYDHVFTVDPTVVKAEGEAFIVGRIEVDPKDWTLEFKLKILGAYRWHPFLSHLKNQLGAMFSKW